MGLPVVSRPEVPLRLESIMKQRKGELTLSTISKLESVDL